MRVIIRYFPPGNYYLLPHRKTREFLVNDRCGLDFPWRYSIIIDGGRSTMGREVILTASASFFLLVEGSGDIRRMAGKKAEAVRCQEGEIEL